MKKVLVAVAIAGCMCLNVAAQQKHHIIVGASARKKVVKDTVIQNFKVCKNDNGYAICGEAPHTQNSTYDGTVKKVVKRPVYEKSKSDVIELKSIPGIPKTTLMTKPGPETQSGVWLGVNSWNGVW